MAEILLAISAWQLAMRLKQPMSRAGCYTFCQPSSVSNHWLFVPVPPLTWNCQVAILGMKGTHDENDGTGMAIRLRCLDVLEWVLLMMAWDADKSQDLFEDDCLHLFLVGSGPHNSEATPYHWDIATRTLLWIQKTIITVYQNIRKAFPCWNAVSNTILHETTQGTPFGGSFIKHLRVTWHHHPYPIV